MRVVAFNGSPRKGGNTSIMIQQVFASLQKYDIETEEIQIGGHLLHGCKACGTCRKIPGKCVYKDDPINDWIEIMRKADGIILASPTYFANVTTEMKAFIDRTGYVLKPEGVLKRRVGAPIVTARRGGAIQTYNTLMSYFGITEMLVPMSNYWNVGFGSEIGAVNDDAEGLKTMDTLGENMAWLLKKIHA